VRSLFIIGPDKKIKLIISYPASTGRNFQEILRVIDSLQLTAYHSVATPADWKDGEQVVVLPSIKTEDIPAKFPKGFTAGKTLFAVNTTTKQIRIRLKSRGREDRLGSAKPSTVVRIYPRRLTKLIN
jgi:hypothetical protein